MKSDSACPVFVCATRAVERRKGAEGPLSAAYLTGQALSFGFGLTGGTMVPQNEMWEENHMTLDCLSAPFVYRLACRVADRHRLPRPSRRAFTPASDPCALPQLLVNDSGCLWADGGFIAYECGHTFKYVYVSLRHVREEENAPDPEVRRQLRAAEKYMRISGKSAWLDAEELRSVPQIKKEVTGADFCGRIDASNTRRRA